MSFLPYLSDHEAKLANYLHRLDFEQAANDAEHERRDLILEDLEDDELIDEANDAFEQLSFNADSAKRVRLIINDIAKAAINGCRADQKLSAVICKLTYEDIEMMKAFLFKNAKESFTY